MGSVEQDCKRYLGRFGGDVDGLLDVVLDALEAHDDPPDEAGRRERVRQVCLLASRAHALRDAAVVDDMAGPKVDRFLLMLCELGPARRDEARADQAARLYADLDRLGERLLDEQTLAEPLWMSVLFLETAAGRTLAAPALRRRLARWAHEAPDGWDALFGDPGRVDHEPLPTDEQLAWFVEEESRGRAPLAEFLASLADAHVNVRCPQGTEMVQVDQLLFLWWRFRCLPGLEPSKDKPATALELSGCMEACGFLDMREGHHPSRNHLDQQLHHVRKTARARLDAPHRAVARALILPRIFCHPKVYRPRNLILLAESAEHD